MRHGRSGRRGGSRRDAGRRRACVEESPWRKCGRIRVAPSMARFAKVCSRSTSREYGFCCHWCGISPGGTTQSIGLSKTRVRDVCPNKSSESRCERRCMCPERRGTSIVSGTSMLVCVRNVVIGVCPNVDVGVCPERRCPCCPERRCPERRASPPCGFRRVARCGVFSGQIAWSRPWLCSYLAS